MTPKTQTSQEKISGRFCVWATAAILGSLVGGFFATIADAQDNTDMPQTLRKDDRAAAPKKQDDENSFRVLSYQISVEGPRAELCLALNAPIAIQDRASLAALVTLQKGDAKQTVSANDLSLTPTDFCVQGLQQGARYQFALKKLKSAQGQTLSTPFALSFDVPHRKPALQFVGRARNAEMPRLALDGMNTNLVLRGLNVTATRLILYRITDPSLFAAILQKRDQIDLAPTESLTFAKDNGQQVWQGDLIFGDKPDVAQNLSVPLPIGNTLTPGVYFLAVTPKGGDEKNIANIATLFAGTWFRVSDLELEATREKDAVTIKAIDGQKNIPLADVALSVAKESGEGLAEARTDAQGLARISLPAGLSDQRLIATGLAAQGQPALRSLAPAPTQTQMPEAETAKKDKNFLTTDRPLYKPRDTILVTALQHAPTGNDKTSFVKLLRPDGSFYAEQKIDLSPQGLSFARLTVPASAEGGDWRLLWQQSDGRVLAEKKIDVRGEIEDLQIDLAADRTSLEAQDDALGFTIKLRGKTEPDGKVEPLAWRVGQLVAQVAPLELAAWRDYTFGILSREPEKKTKSVSFLTDANGVARIQMRDLAAFAGTTAARAVSFHVDLDRIGTSRALTLPVHGETSWIGAKRIAKDQTKQQDQNIAQDGDVVFDIVALDAAAKKKAENGLFYQVYEQGRSFQWAQGEGHWDYTPLPSHRRIMGGKLSLSDRDANLLPLSLTAGNYSLEITNAAGDLLTRQQFVVNGRSQKQTETAQQAPTLQKTTEALTPPPSRGEMAVTLPSHLFAGATLSLPLSVAPPQKNGSRPLALTENATPFFVAGTASFAATKKDQTPSVTDIAPFALDKEGKGVLRLNLPRDAKDLRLNLVAWRGDQIIEKTLALPVRHLLTVEKEVPSKIVAGDKATLSYRLDIGGVVDENFMAELTVPAGLKIEEPLRKEIKMRKGKPYVLTFTATAQEPAQGLVKLTLTPPKESPYRDAQNLQTTQDIVIESAGQKLKTAVETWKAETMFAKESLADSTRLVIISPVPTGDLAPALQSLVAAKPATTSELAAWLERASFFGPLAVRMNLIDAARLEDMKKTRLILLQKRQRADGGFSAWPYGDGDIASTADALRLLQTLDGAAAFHAAHWLRQRLENAWFDEAERPARAKAFAALSTLDDEMRRKTRTQDPSALRYFAETSRDKNLSTSTRLAIAHALAGYRDEQESRVWIESARKNADKNDNLQLANLADLAANPLQPPRDLFAEAETLLTKLSKTENASFTTAMAQLDLIQNLSTRHGTWPLEINGKDQKNYGLWMASSTEIAALKSLKNTAKEDRYILKLNRESTPQDAPKDQTKQADPVRLQMQLFAQNGDKLDPAQPLPRDQAILLVIRGLETKAEENGTRRRLTVSSASGFTPLTAARGNSEAFTTLWPWLPQPVTRPLHVGLTDSGLTFELTASPEWRVVCLVTPPKKSPAPLPPLDLRTESGTPLIRTGE